MNRKAFKNQRPESWNLSPPYKEKPGWNSETREGTPPRGGAPSRKNGRRVLFWTIHEYRAIVVLEAWPGVRAYVERPERVAFRVGPRWYRYVPHFRVELDGSALVLELSSTGEPRTPKQALVADLARDHYAGQGVRFVELAHRSVRAQPRYADALRLTKPLFGQPSDVELLRVRDIVADEPVPLADVEDATGISRPHLLAMVRAGRLSLVGRGPITAATRVWRPLLAAPRR